ncbi:MAG: OmpA family protein [Magnetococcus sp. DMHC-8]
MKNLKNAMLAGAALLCASVPFHLDAASPGKWSYGGFTQWHGNEGRTGLGAFGTQCYFCKPDGAVAPPPPPPAPAVAAPPAAPPPPPAAKKCPESAKGATVSQHGCWVIKNLNFRTNSARIEPTGVIALKETLEVLKKNPGLRVEIQGHTDHVGTAAHNKKLSQQRADAVMKHLVGHGVAAQRLTARGYGLERPVGSNATEAGRADNRRVELHVLK